MDSKILTLFINQHNEEHLKAKNPILFKETWYS